LKCVWFLNPCSYEVISWFQAFAFKCNVYRYSKDMGMGKIIPALGGLLGPQGVGSATMKSQLSAMGLAVALPGGAGAAGPGGGAWGSTPANVRAGGVDMQGGIGYGLEGTAGGAAAAADLAALGDGGAGGMMMVEANLERNRVQWRDATRNSRRLYVGHVNSSTTTEALAALISEKVAAAGVTPWHTEASGTLGKMIETCHVSEKGFAFLECVALEDVNAVLAFDGVLIDGRNIKLRRPKDYLAEENPLVTNGTIDDNYRATYDVIINPRVIDSPTKIFLGGGRTSCIQFYPYLESPLVSE
jgi:hypothetical protein